MTIRELVSYINSLPGKTEGEIDVAYDKAHEYVFSNYMLDDIQSYIPYKTGYLNSCMDADYDHYTVNYDNCLYAQYAFEPEYVDGFGNLQPKNYTATYHPDACGNPLDVAVENHQTEWLEDILNYTIDILLYEVEL